MAGTRRKPLLVACPACGRKVEYSATNPSRPFCSERCRTVDLGAWASGAYQIPGAPLEELDDGISPESPAASG